MAVIEFDYAKAIRQARDLDDISDDLKNKASRQLETLEYNLRKNWDGEAAAVFTRKCVELSERLQSESRAISDIADKIRETARRIKEAEERAKLILSD